jgi:homoserine O-succinyltransferase
MPIIIPTGEMSGLHERLSAAGAAVISQEQAEQQDIRPARIALLNLMPAEAMKRTETQWLQYMSHSVLQIEPVLVKFDDDKRERVGASRAEVLNRYRPFREVADSQIDGLIVTGDNLELRQSPDADPTDPLPFEEISYAEQLADVIDWARSNVRSTIYSCLASHFVLDYLYGVEREVTGTKTFGVFDHRVDHTVESEITLGLDDTFRAPHSRWGDVPVELLGTTAVRVLARNNAIGWLLAEDTNEAGGSDLYIQGHPEYDRCDLQIEHVRDGGLTQDQPEGYYSPEGKPRLTWSNDARALHANWIASLYRHFSD